MSVFNEYLVAVTETNVKLYKVKALRDEDAIKRAERLWYDDEKPLENECVDRTFQIESVKRRVFPRKKPKKTRENIIRILQGGK